MELLERDQYLAGLDTALREASTGTGRIALVSGEAGIGKTTLVERFTQNQGSRTPVLWGVCDSLFTPRPLGPLYDMGPQIQGVMPELVRPDRNPSAIFAAVLGELQRHTVIIVFEDVHWADEVTLDLLRFLGRRIKQTRSMLVMTYRDDELGSLHPLRTLLGDLVASSTSRLIQLPPFTEKAVQALVGERPVDVSTLHRQTGGNPFFVTEVLASPARNIPQTVREAVLARAARLSISGHAVLEAAAIIGPRIEPWLLSVLTGAEAHAAEECISVGMLSSQGDVLAFRHELARQTILESISPTSKQKLHQMALQALQHTPIAHADPARLAHHAEASAEGQAVLEFAPAAARLASKAGAHREASILYALALRFAGALPLAERASMFEAHAWESNLIDLQSEVIASRRQAIELWRQAGNPLKLGDNLAQLALTLMGSSQEDEAVQTCQTAIQILESLPAGRELALAYRIKALLHTFNHEYDEAIALANKSVALAKRFGDVRVLAMAYDTLGTTLLYVDYERGSQILRECLAIAQEAGLEARVATVYGNWGATACDLYKLDDAENYLAKGIAYSAERDLDLIRLHLLAWQALTQLRLGRWAEAAEIVSQVIVRPEITSINRIPALVVFGSLRARMGDPDPQASLEEALALAARTGAFQNIGPVRTARAEAAWLAGIPERTLEEAGAVYDLALSKQHPWIAGELAFWRWRSGDSVKVTEWMAKPFALQIAGDWRSAAEEWQRLGCPYEQARALADGDLEAQIAALKIFEQLGAQPMAENLRHLLRSSGASNLPRKPRVSTRQNPFGLTSRQVEILRLLTEGATNAEIAAQLNISPKTADHHVSAILAKLNVHSREAAASLARQHPQF